MRYLFALNTNNDIEIILNKGISIDHIIPCLGYWMGKVETSFLVNDTSLDNQYHDKIHALCAEYKQEAYLTIDQNNETVLWYLDANKLPESLGAWTNVSKEYILNVPNWTKIGSQYYVAKFK